MNRPLLACFPMILFCVMLASCSAAKEFDRTVLSSSYDFSGYTAKGFMFSPEQYLQPYEAIGMIKLTIIPETRKKPPAPREGSKFKDRPPEQGSWWTEEIDQTVILEEAYTSARKMGADAIVRLAIERKPIFNGDIFVTTYEVSGFAIKRK